MKLKDIPCQVDHSNHEGCAVCGGYSYVLVVRYCPTCNQPAYVRPGSYTSYDGKRWRTFDGVEITDRVGGSTCSFCPDEEKKKGGGR